MNAINLFHLLEFFDMILASMEILISPEYHLSPINMNHVHDFLLYYNKPEVTQWIPRPLHPYTLYECQQWVKKLLKDRDHKINPRHFVIENKSNEFIGYAGFPRTYEREPHCSEVFLWIRPKFLKQGIGTIALNAICEYGSDQLGLSRIEAMVMSKNEAAKKVLTDSQFELEGILKRKFVKDVEYFDADLFSKLFL